MTELGEYMPTIWAMGGMAALMLVQVIVADFAGIRARHQPGTPIPADTNSFHFRASRTHANTNETVVIFVILAIFGMLAGASATWLNYITVGFVFSRAVYAAAYYANRPLFRSITFGISLALLAAMLIVTIRNWI